MRNSTTKCFVQKMLSRKNFQETVSAYLQRKCKCGSNESSSLEDVLWIESPSGILLVSCTDMKEKDISNIEPILKMADRNYHLRGYIFHGKNHFTCALKFRSAFYYYDDMAIPLELKKFESRMLPELEPSILVYCNV